MTMIEKTNENIVEKDKKSTIRYRAYPDIHRYNDHDKKTIEIEISLPGVEKEEIKLKALDGWFKIEARRDDLLYSANYSWGAEIVPNKTEAKYHQGLLKITAYIRDPLDGAKEITF